MKIMHLLSSLSKTLVTFLSSFLFLVLFYKKDWGLNLFIFQLISLTLVYQIANTKLNKTQRWLLLGATLSSVFLLIQHTYLAFWMSNVLLLMFASSVYSEKVQSIHLLFLNLFNSILRSFVVFIKAFRTSIQHLGVPMYALKRLGLFVIPLIVIVVFFQLYAASNPTFGKFSASLFTGMSDVLTWIGNHMQWTVLGVFLIGLLISIPIYHTSILYYLEEADEQNNGVMKRIRSSVQGFSFNPLALKHEVKAGTFLLVFLNAMLALLLVFEAKDVWFGFEWNGEYLKSFVHQGMYLLLITILISIGIALYFFRGNLNFYSKSESLKKLTFLWLMLNGILVLSVAIRDLYYIHYFALAYRRIALLIFLIATTIGLCSVFLKIRNCRNAMYLWRINSASVLLILVFSSAINWDRFIANYNFQNADRAFLHLDYLSSLSDSSLPYLQCEHLNLAHVYVKQMERLNESFSSYSEKYISAGTYRELIDQRTDQFQKRWEQASWLEWNFSEWWSYRKLNN